MTKKQMHVTYHKGPWKAQKSGAKRASAVCNTKAEAIQRAEQIARHQKLETKIHNKDGRISGGNSYGNDPCPPRDKK
ncbi:MAG: DUF2188 domain-containing protein [Rickettsiales bacterium]|jgi:uncharacterized protein YdaT|nr:DUF2188 domain-containing protein [Rickettsiales bacterium]